MPVLQTIRALLGRRGLPIASIPSALLGFVLLVDAAALLWSAAAVASTTLNARDTAVLGLMLLIALGFEESATRVGRLTLRFSAPLKRDMTSVWAVAAAVALPSGYSVLLLVSVFAYLWVRQQRAAAQPFYRIYFTASSMVLGCLVAGEVVRALGDAWSGLPWALSSSIAVIAAIALQTTVNRSLVTVALLGVGVRGRELMGSRDENLTELSTLCLGGLVAVAAVHEPWLCILVVVPMVVLQRAALVRELEAAAITDAKTGLLNAVAWEQLAKREIARAEREQRTVSVVIVDIDRFKSVNDRYGHLVGDKVLAGVARELTEGLRQYDGLGRFGGEEFVAVLPDAGEHDALVVAERVRLRVNQRCVADFVPGLAESDRGGERLSVSIGVAVRKVDQAELSDMLHAADQALYRAKWNGRNQVQLARRGDEIPDIVSI